MIGETRMEVVEAAGVGSVRPKFEHSIGCLGFGNSCELNNVAGDKSEATDNQAQREQQTVIFEHRCFLPGGMGISPVVVCGQPKGFSGYCIVSAREHQGMGGTHVQDVRGGEVRGSGNRPRNSGDPAKMEIGHRVPQGNSATLELCRRPIEERLG